MALEPGTRIGQYEVSELLGAGGMGEVYRARDTRLDREVALKVLPETLRDDPDRLARFEREAKVLASLNHPNIGGIHGLEESGDSTALVLELIEGPTLADVIERLKPEARSLKPDEASRGLPVDQALHIASQIADALEAAHEQGVIHRDLKPANIKVKPDGTVKVLDFGLAKAVAPDPSSTELADSPTISLTAAATQIGMVIGTAAYMAPEQAKGQPVDKRADVWAFGAVLFEMLTGRKLFEAGDVSEMLASVLVKELRRLRHRRPCAGSRPLGRPALPGQGPEGTAARHRGCATGAERHFRGTAEPSGCGAGPDSRAVVAAAAPACPGRAGAAHGRRRDHEPGCRY